VSNATGNDTGSGEEFLGGLRIRFDVDADQREAQDLALVHRVERHLLAAGPAPGSEIQHHELAAMLRQQSFVGRGRRA
jgi:hypothetical protein